MSGQRGQAHAHEDARNICEVCGQFGWKGNPVTVRQADPTPKHIRCRAAEKEAAR
jgi:hypothetical protein